MATAVLVRLLSGGQLRTEGQKRGTKYFAGPGGSSAAKPNSGKKAGRKAGKRGRRGAAKKK